MNALWTRDPASGISLLLLSILTFGPATLSAQAPQSLYQVLLELVIREHLPDRRVEIVLDGLPRIDVGMAVAEARGDLAAPYHEMAS